MKPAMSVTVVRIIEEDKAGSCPNFLSMMGTKAPETAAIVIDEIMASAIMSAKPTLLLQKYTPAPQVMAIATPFINAALASFRRTLGQCLTVISRKVRPRMVTASACAPVFPD